MANKRIISLIMMIIFGLSLIITIPIFTFSSSLSNYGTIDKLLTFDYAPYNASPIEKLNLNVDVGDVEIKYVTTPVDYYAKIQVDIEMFGQKIAEKRYSDYFSIDWQNSSSPLNFTIELKSESWFDPSLWLTQNVDIIITLNANILFDINITINEKGNVHLLVPYAVPINNIDVNTNKGNIFYDFQFCTLEGNITGIANDGNIELIAKNPEYTRNTIWTYKSMVGGITIDISHINHYKIMNATITGSLVGNDFGDIILYYYDNTANIGAKITINNNTQALKDFGSDWEHGFEIETLYLEGDPFGYEFTSTDLSPITNYNLFLEGLSNEVWRDYRYEVHLSSS